MAVHWKLRCWLKVVERRMQRIWQIWFLSSDLEQYRKYTYSFPGCLFIELSAVFQGNDKNKLKLWLILHFGEWVTKGLRL